MRIHLDETVLGKLVDDLMAVYDKKSLVPGDCRLMSAHIFKKTDNHVSETTLKRLFGFAKRNYNFSLYTLDTFAQYMNQKNWEVYYANLYLQGHSESTESNWHALRAQAMRYSFYTLRATQNASGVHFSKAIHRQSFTDYLNRFLNSSKTIAPIIAPAGFGKSVGLAQSVLKLWMNEAPMYPDDICCYISVHQLFNITKNKNSLTDWFSRILQVNEEINLDKLKIDKSQKLVIIIDGFDERAFSADKLKHICAGIIEFINFHSGYNWVKFIVSIRPSIWEKIVQSYITASFHHNKLFIDESYPDCNWLNHALPFSRMEIKKILFAYNVTGKKVDSLSEEFIMFISYPRHLDILCKLLSSGPVAFGSEEYLIFKINEINLKALFSNQYNSACVLSFLEELIEGDLKGNTEDNKEKLLGKNNEHLETYLQMKDQFLLIEESVSRHFLYPVSRISFSNKYLKSYFTSWVYIKENNYSLSKEFIDKLYTSAEGDFPRSGFIKWYLTEGFCRKEPNAVLEVFRSTLISAKEKFELFEFLIHQHIASNNTDYELLQQLEEENAFVAYSLNNGIIFSYQNSTGEAVMLTLLKICSDRKHTPSLLLCLFMNAIIRLDTPQSEIWLREFRICCKNDTRTSLRMAGELMACALELTRFQVYNDSTEKTIQAISNNIDTLLKDSVYFTHMLILMGGHILLFRGKHTFLNKFLNQAVSMVNQHCRKFVAVHQLLNQMQLYAALREGHETIGLPIVNETEYEGTRETCNLIFSNMLLAARYRAENKPELVYLYASGAYRISHQATHNVYRLLALDLMREVKAAAIH